MPLAGGSTGGRHFLQIPGPTNVPDRVLRAMAKAAGEALALPVRELDYTLPPAREQNYAFGE